MVSGFNGQIDIWGGIIGNPLLCIIGGLSGSYAIIDISKLISSKLFIFICQNTMTIMGTHMLLKLCICTIDLFSFLSVNHQRLLLRKKKQRNLFRRLYRFRIRY